MLVPLLVFASVAVVGQGAADASTPTGMLGNTSAYSVVGTTSGSACSAGDFAVGAQIWVEGRGYTSGIQLLCVDSSGNTVPAGVAGPGYGATADSTCNPGDLAVGLYGTSGDIQDSIGIVCNGPSGAYDAAMIGGGGGSPAGPTYCPAANALTSVTVWSGDYFGGTVDFGIQGFCDPTDTSLSISPGVSPPTVNATSPFGTSVSFATPSASDNAGPLAVTCDHTSGSTFGIGLTTVTCSATDFDAMPSTVSTAIAVNVLSITPRPPVLDSASAGNASALVAFEPPAWDGGNAITSYTASCSSTDGGTARSATGPQSPLSVQGLSNNHTYRCVVRATNFVGTSGPSNASSPITPGVVETCFTTQTCDGAASSPSTSSNPPALVDVKGVVTGTVGTILLTTAPSSTLHCPGSVVGGSSATTLTDTGFSGSLTATVKLLAVATGKGKVCYSSDVPFLSETNPTAPEPGTAFLLSCTAVGNVAPCVLSITSGASAVIAKVLVPAGDPTFSVVLPTGRLVWPSTFPSGTVGTQYSTHLLSKGGKAPFHWSITSGKLPPGLSISAPTGTVTGKPTAAGTFKCVVRVTDSEAKPQTANISVSITIK